MRQWGDASSVGAFVSVSAGNEFQYVDGASSPLAGCVGVAQVGAQLLGASQEIVRAYAGAGASDHEVQASARVYLLGDATPVWHREGTTVLPLFERSYGTPDVSEPVAVVEPIQLNVALSGKGVARVQGDLKPHIQPGHDFGCDAVLTPSVRAIASGGAKVVPMPGVQQVLEILVGDVSAGLTVNLNLLDLSLPARLGLNVRTDSQRQVLLGLDQQAALEIKADLLNGQLEAWLEMDLEGVGGFVASLFGIDDVQRWSWDLYDFPGEHAQLTLVSFQNSIPFVP